MERSSQAGRGASTRFSSPLWDTPVCTMRTPEAAAMRERGSGSLVRETYRPANSLRGGRYQRCPAGWLVGRCAMWAPHEQASQTLAWAAQQRPIRRVCPIQFYPSHCPYREIPAVSTGATRGTRFAVDGMGVVVGPLVKRRSRWLLVGVTSIHLPRRMTCALAIGTLVRVAYTEREGRRLVETIQPLLESPPVPLRRP